MGTTKTRLSTEWIPRTVRSHRNNELAHEVTRERIGDDEIVVMYRGVKTGMQFTRHYHESDLNESMMENLHLTHEPERPHVTMYGL